MIGLMVWTALVLLGVVGATNANTQIKMRAVLNDAAYEG